MRAVDSKMSGLKGSLKKGTRRGTHDRKGMGPLVGGVNEEEEEGGSISWPGYGTRRVTRKLGLRPAGTSSLSPGPVDRERQR